jgi:hypothetical protein
MNRLSVYWFITRNPNLLFRSRHDIVAVKQQNKKQNYLDDRNYENNESYDRVVFFPLDRFMAKESEYKSN